MSAINLSGATQKIGKKSVKSQNNTNDNTNTNTSKDANDGRRLNLNHYCICEVSSRTKQYDSGGEYLPLTDYLVIAKKCIAKCANLFMNGLAKKMLENEDAISHVIVFLVNADSKFNPDIGLSREQFRGLYAVYAIRRYVQMGLSPKNKMLKSLDYKSKAKKNSSDVDELAAFLPAPTESPDQNLINEELHQDLNNCSRTDLTDREYFVMFERNVNRSTFTSIAESLGLSDQRVSEIYRAAIKKINLAELKEYVCS